MAGAAHSDVDDAVALAPRPDGQRTAPCAGEHTAGAVDAAAAAVRPTAGATAVGGKRKANTDSNPAAAAAAAVEPEPKRQQIAAPPGAATTLGAAPAAAAPPAEAAAVRPTTMAVRPAAAATAAAAASAATATAAHPAGPPTHDGAPPSSTASPFGADPDPTTFDADQALAWRVLMTLRAQERVYGGGAVVLRPDAAAALLARAIAVDRFVQTHCGLEKDPHAPTAAVARAAVWRAAMQHPQRWVHVRACADDLIPPRHSPLTADGFRALMARIQPRNQPPPVAAAKHHESDGSDDDDDDVGGGRRRPLDLATALYRFYCDEYASTQQRQLLQLQRSHTDEPVEQRYGRRVGAWVVRALLCIRFVRADAAANAHADDHSGVCMRLDSTQLDPLGYGTDNDDDDDDDDAARHSSDSDSDRDTKANRRLPLAYACNCAPGVALALLSLAPHERVAYGIDLDSPARAGGGDRNTPLNCAVTSTTPDVQLITQLLRESGERALNAPVVDTAFRMTADAEDSGNHWRARVPLAHWLVVRAGMAWHQHSPTPVPARKRYAYAQCLAALCAPDISRNDGSGYRLCSTRYEYCGTPPLDLLPHRRGGGGRPPQPPLPFAPRTLLAHEMVGAVHAAVQLQITRRGGPYQRLPSEDETQHALIDDEHAFRQHVQRWLDAAVARIDAYAAALPVRLRAVLCGDDHPGSGRSVAPSSLSSRSPFPLPLVSLVVSYVLYPRDLHR